MIEAAEHMLSTRIPNVDTLQANGSASSEAFRATFQQAMSSLDQGQGVLILADIYGASHTNMARTFLRKDSIEMITGVNLPMLIRVLNYRELALTELMEKAFAGGSNGIIRAIVKSPTNSG